MDDAEAVDLRIARFFFDESDDDGFPWGVAVAVAEAKVEHTVVDAPYGLAKGVELFKFGAGWVESAWVVEHECALGGDLRARCLCLWTNFDISVSWLGEELFLVVVPEVYNCSIEEVGQLWM
jgi:hypothetical protein